MVGMMELSEGSNCVAPDDTLYKKLSNMKKIIKDFALNYLQLIVKPDFVNERKPLNEGHVVEGILQKLCNM